MLLSAIILAAAGIANPALDASEVAAAVGAGALTGAAALPALGWAAAGLALATAVVSIFAIN